MPFRELDEWFDSSLKLPIQGKTYRIESVDAETGVWCQRIFSVAVKAADGGDVDAETVKTLAFDDDQEIDLYSRLMGPTYDEMRTDGLPWEWIKLAGTTCLMWVVNGMEAAEAFWNAGGGTPEAGRPEPQDRKAPARKARQDSTAGKRRPTGAEAATPGQKSSATGT